MRHPVRSQGPCHVPESVSQRETGRSGAGDRQRLRSRPALRRRCLRGDPGLQSPSLPAAGSHRPAVRKCQVHSARDPAEPRGHDGSRGADCGGQRSGGRVCPTRRHARGGLPGARYPPDEQSAGDHHRGHDHALSGGAVRARARDHYGQHDSQPSRGFESPHQVAQLSQQYSGEDRSDRYRQTRGPDAQRQRGGGGVHGG